MTTTDGGILLDFVHRHPSFGQQSSSSSLLFLPSVGSSMCGARACFRSSSASHGFRTKPCCLVAGGSFPRFIACRWLKQPADAALLSAACTRFSTQAPNADPESRRQAHVGSRGARRWSREGARNEVVSRRAPLPPRVTFSCLPRDHRRAGRPVADTPLALRRICTFPRWPAVPSLTALPRRPWLCSAGARRAATLDERAPHT